MAASEASPRCRSAKHDVELDVLEDMDTREYEELSESPKTVARISVGGSAAPYGCAAEAEMPEEGEIVDVATVDAGGLRPVSASSKFRNLTVKVDNKQKLPPTATQQAERAKRFGLDVEMVPHEKLQLSGLYKSLNLKSTDLEPGNLRGIRPEAIHIRGVSDMNSDDILEYFKDFSPADVEWVDSSSCNVIWRDAATAARAMMKLSSSLPSPDLLAMQPLHKGAKGHGKGDVDESSDTSTAELTFDYPDFDMKVISEGTATDASDRKSLDKIAVENAPPGRWRFGNICTKSVGLYFRYATKADKKLPGFEKRSMTADLSGLPSRADSSSIASDPRKRKAGSHDRSDSERRATTAEEFANSRSNLHQRGNLGGSLLSTQRSRPKGTELVTYDDIFGELYTEDTEKDSLPSHVDLADLAGLSSSAQSVQGRLGYRQRGHRDDDDEPPEPDAIRPPPTKKRPAMKMRADEEEELAKARKKQLEDAVADSVAVKTTFDARSKISGGSAAVRAMSLAKGRPDVVVAPRLTDLRSKLRSKH